jgi:hypothetical protein
LNSQGAPIFSKLSETLAFSGALASLGVRVFSEKGFVG